MTPNEAAKALDRSLSRIHKLCKDGRLGYSTPKYLGRYWVITQEEIDAFKAVGPLPAGRPEKKS